MYCKVLICKSSVFLKSLITLCSPSTLLVFLCRYIHDPYLNSLSLSLYVALSFNWNPAGTVTLTSKFYDRGVCMLVVA